MPPSNTIHHESLLNWVVVRPEPAGQFTAQLLGLPELLATATSSEEAIEQIRARILEWIALSQLVPVEIPKEHPLGFSKYLIDQVRVDIFGRFGD